MWLLLSTIAHTTIILQDMDWGRDALPTIFVYSQSAVLDIGILITTKYVESFL